MDLEIFFKSYINNLHESLNTINLKKLKNVIQKLESIIKKKKKIFVCGNGGSAAISNHYICDYLKLIKHNTKYKPKIISLSNNVETITAISNDISFSEIFKYQAESLAEKGDIFIIISSSGKSSNVVKLAKWAKQMKYEIISFTGFDGGKLKKISDVNININSNNYGKVEDSHHILMHLIMQFIIIKNKNIKKLRM